MRQLKIAQKITNRESVSINKYFLDVENHSFLIDAAEEVQLAKRIKEGDEKALQELITANLRFVISVAKQYNNKGNNLDDLISAGNEGLIKAAKGFDHTKGFKFISYAVWWIRQAITEYIANNARQIRLPLNKQNIYNKTARCAEKLAQKLHREPTEDEIVDEMIRIGENIKEDAIREIYTNFTYVESLDAPIGNNDDAQTRHDIIAGDDPHSIIPKLNRVDLKREIKDSLERLDPREKEVVTRFFGLSGKQSQTLHEIALAMDFTPERIRQIKEKALRRLKATSRKRLKEFL